MISECRPIIFEIDFDNNLYYSIDGEINYQLFEVDSVFPNLCSVEISNEQTSFYVCTVIASVFGNDFKEDFIDVCNSYNFNAWKKNDENSENFFELSTYWIQSGSLNIKLVASAAKYALVREKKKK